MEENELRDIRPTIMLKGSVTCGLAYSVEWESDDGTFDICKGCTFDAIAELDTRRMALRV